MDGNLFALYWGFYVISPLVIFVVCLFVRERMNGVACLVP